MIIAKNIYHANGLLLLSKDTPLDANLIARLGRVGIDSVYVQNSLLNVEPQEILHEKTRVETIRQTQKVFENFRKASTINVKDVQNIIKKIVEDAIDNRNMLIHLTDIRTHDDYTFGHSINVCLLSVMIGIKLYLKEEQLYELAMGAILHDIGKMFVPTEILNKPGGLSAEEWKVMRGHSDKGFELLRKQRELSLVSAHVAYQHHEHYDGTGYGRGLSRDSIHQFARIAAVADLYDAITSDRPYRKAFLPHEAYEVILGSMGTKLDPQLTAIFLENIALYPVGSTVLLDTGEIGVVINVLPKLQARPLVRVIAGSDGRPLEGPDRVVDLTKELTRFIVKVFEPQDILNFCKYAS
jgi:HD-GYP domain-containing protein (c-di-GMP phosphodiesterase class II)